ncbi:MAG TPA: FHA domain-containing protein, partial [Pyrinomonadaceae bacterium]|nr:FHA domain-containing protein [Pyrinomonadaceae bacterium]
MKKSANIKPRLIALNGETKPQPVYLDLDTDKIFTFGRHPECDLPVGDIAVSRRHCQIIREAENFILEDLGSHNGTFVNDLPVKVHRLEHGDRIRVGNFYFMFLIDENDDAPLSKVQFDHGALVTNSIICLSPNAGADFPSDLNILIKLGKAINELKESESLQRRILEIILEFIPARRGAILLMDRGLDEDLNEPQAVCVFANGYTDSAPMQVSRTVSEQVLREQIALLSNDLSDKNFEKAESLIASRVSSLLCAPLKIGESKGLIYLDTNDPKIRFTENHLEQMTALSFLVSGALANAESIENLR